MLKAQIQRFIYKVSVEEPVTFSYYYDNSEDSAMARVQYLNFGGLFGFDGWFMTLWVNKYWFNQYKKEPIVLKACLLHEVGHIETEAHRINTASRQEYEAQVWAINRAKELNMTAIARYLESEWDLWAEEKWNTKYRRYIMAAKIWEQERGQRSET